MDFNNAFRVSLHISKPVCSLIPLLWYNCTGWLGIKHQLTLIVPSLVLVTLQPPLTSCCLRLRQKSSHCHWTPTWRLLPSRPSPACAVPLLWTLMPTAATSTFPRSPPRRSPASRKGPIRLRTSLQSAMAVSTESEKYMWVFCVCVCVCVCVRERERFETWLIPVLCGSSECLWLWFILILLKTPLQ